MSNGPVSVPVVSAAEVTGATASMLAGGYRGNGQQLCPVAPHSLAARGAVAVSGTMPCLESLNAELLGSFWPMECVLVGVQVNKRLRSSLLAASLHVVLHSRRAETEERERRLAAPLHRTMKKETGKGPDQPGREGQKGEEEAVRASPSEMVEDLARFQHPAVQIDLLLPSSPELAVSALEVLWKGSELSRNQHGATGGIVFLDLSDNGLRDGQIELLATALGSACPALRHLDLGRNRLSARGAEAIGQHVRDWQELEGLSLRGNNIRSEGTRLLCAGLEQTSGCGLLHLDLRGNGLLSAGAAAVARMLQANACPRLQGLVLSYNGIGSEGVRFLAAGIASSTALTVLDLRNDTVGAEGVALLAKALGEGGVGAGLKWLDLGFNGIGGDGAATAGVILRACPALEWLSCAGNKLGCGGLELVGSEAARCCPALTLLDLSANLSPGPAPPTANVSNAPANMSTASNVPPAAANFTAGGEEAEAGGQVVLARGQLRMLVGPVQRRVRVERYWTSGSSTYPHLAQLQRGGGAARAEAEGEGEREGGGEGDKEGGREGHVHGHGHGPGWAAHWQWLRSSEWRRVLAGGFRALGNPWGFGVRV